MNAKITKAMSIIRDKMDEHGLKDWSLVTDRAVRRAGQCRYYKKQISISTVANSVRTLENIVDTGLHEIAHAIVGPGHGHDRHWSAAAKRIGARPDRCYTDGGSVPGKYVMYCQNCQSHVSKSREYHRKIDVSMYRHRACGKEVVLIEK